MSLVRLSLAAPSEIKIPIGLGKPRLEKRADAIRRKNKGRAGFIENAVGNRTRPKKESRLPRREQALPETPREPTLPRRPRIADLGSRASILKRARNRMKLNEKCEFC